MNNGIRNRQRLVAYNLRRYSFFVRSCFGSGFRKSCGSMDIYLEHNRILAHRFGNIHAHHFHGPCRKKGYRSIFQANQRKQNVRRSLHSHSDQGKQRRRYAYHFCFVALYVPANDTQLLAHERGVYMVCQLHGKRNMALLSVLGSVHNIFQLFLFDDSIQPGRHSEKYSAIGRLYPGYKSG